MSLSLVKCQVKKFLSAACVRGSAILCYHDCCHRISLTCAHSSSRALTTPFCQVAAPKQPCCSAAGRAQSGFEGNLIRQRHSRRFCLETCSCRLTMEPSRGECQALRPRPEREGCNPKPIFFTCPTISQVWKQDGKPTTTTLNSKKEFRNIEDNSNCSQPLACAQASHPFVQTGGGKAGSPLTQMEPSLSSIKQAPFFHCTIARLAAAHTFLMAEISRHALTDLS